MIYLDNAATTYPKPEAVYRAVDQCMREFCANPGRGGHRMSLQAGRTVFEARAALGELFNIERHERIVFTLNATDSINLGLKGLLKKGDHVITTSIEHNSVMRPLKALEAIGVETTIVQCSETGELILEDVEREIRENTAMIVTAHASNVLGTLMPVEQIGRLARERNIKYMIDAAQTAGVYDIDVKKMNIDLLAFTGHKSLYGPQGVGGLYIGEGIALNPIREGGTGSESESFEQPALLPDRYESGTPNTPGIAGLLAGVNFIKEIGIEKIRSHEQELAEYFLDKLKRIDKIRIYGPKDMKKQVPVISLNIGDIGSSDISFILDESFGIATRPALHCSPMAHRTSNTLDQGTVRFSIGYFNTIAEIDQTIYALRQITSAF